MKKKLLIAAAAVIVLLIAFFWYMESHYSSSTLSHVDMTEDEIIAEMPDILISERDKELMKCVLSMPEVQTALSKAEASDLVTVIEDTSSLSGFLSEGETIIELSIIGGNSLYLTISNGDVTSTIFEHSFDGISKNIGVYDDNGDCKAIYVNQHDVITKSILKHEWFFWVRYLFADK